MAQANDASETAAEGKKKGKAGGKTAGAAVKKAAKPKAKPAPKKPAPKKPARRRWSRTIVDRNAVDELSRDRRWRRRGTRTGVLGLLLVVSMVAVLGGGGGAALALFNRALSDRDAPVELTPFGKLALDVFPEALHQPTGYAQGADGTHSLTLTLPAHLLESSAASTDALERLAAPFKGGQRWLKGPEVASRIDRLRMSAPSDGPLKCADHRIGEARMVTRDNGSALRVRDLEIHLLPSC